MILGLSLTKISPPYASRVDDAALCTAFNLPKRQMRIYLRVAISAWPSSVCTVAQIRSVLDHMRGATMTQHVRAGVAVCGFQPVAISTGGCQGSPRTDKKQSAFRATVSILPTQNGRASNTHPEP